MKNFTLLCAAFLMYGIATAQNSNQTTSLPEKIQIDQFQTELLEIKQSKPSKYALLDAYIAKGVQIVHLENANNKAVVLSEIPLKDKTQHISISDFLYYAQNFELNPYVFVWRPQTQRQIFRLEGTDYYVVIPAQSDLK